MNARYNGYFYADQYLNEVYQDLESSYEYNFNDVLKIFPNKDSSTIKANKQKLDDAFKKASQIIEWYKSSDWTDDSYILVGKIRQLRAQFQYAIETFQYVNQTSKDAEARQSALIALMDTYIDMRELDLARDVSRYLSLEEGVSEVNQEDYFLTLAHFHQVEGNQEGLIEALTEVSKVSRNRDQQYRTNFILGQLAERLNKKEIAYQYYDKVTKGTPPYELLFHARLYKMATANYNSQASLEDAYKSFGKMLKDGKNLEYQDAIYYVMGQLEQKIPNLPKAIENYLLATQVEQPNSRQKGLSFLRLGEIYYDEFKNFQLSSAYYDSAIMNLTPAEENYELIKEKQELLQNYVTQLNIIQLNDSLISLSNMNPVSLDAFLDRYLDEKEEKEKLEARRKRANSVDSNSLAGIDNDDSDNSWYFYNFDAVNQGQLEFQRLWGNRPLEDNWRRSSKNIVNVGIVNTSISKTGENSEEALPEPGDSRASEKESLKANIPFTDEQKAALYTAMEDAYMELGSIYRFGFEDDKQAIESYETLLQRFPKTYHRLDALFALYTLYQTIDISASNDYKAKIIQEFPETLVAKTLINPNYLAEKAERTLRLERKYGQAYQLFESGEFFEADRITREILGTFEDVDFLPTVELFAAILKAKTESIVSYEQALDSFIAKYPQNQLTDYANSLKSAINPEKERVVESLGSDYSEDFQQLHVIAISFSKTVNSKESIEAQLESFNATNFPNLILNIGSLMFDEEQNIEILFISPLKTKTAAERYNEKLSEALSKWNLKEDTNFHNFEITRDNFTKLFGTKNLKEYLTFNQRFYK